MNIETIKDVLENPFNYSLDEYYIALRIEERIIEKYNAMVSALDEDTRLQCEITHFDTLESIRKKCNKAKGCGVYYVPMVQLYSEPGDSGSSGDAGDGGALEEKKTSTERVRKYYRNNPGKVRAYLRKTAKDRAARNRDRKKAIKKHGKSKMKNHDVHHPNGPNGGSWRLAKKDHGPDKKNESILSEGGAAGHMSHPFEDTSLKFSDFKEMIKRGLLGGLDSDGPVTEKLDGRNIAFTVKDGKILFARNKGHVKNNAENAMDVQALIDKFSSTKEVADAFANTANDLNAAIEKLSPEEKTKVFADGSKFMNVEIITSEKGRVIPYDKNVLVFHGTIQYDRDGNQVDRNIEDGKELSTAITKVGADKQKTFGISGPKTIAFSDENTAKYIQKAKKYASKINQLRDEFNLSDDATYEDYKKAWWNRELTSLNAPISSEDKAGLINRWAVGDKQFGVHKLSSPEAKEWFRDFEKNKLNTYQKKLSNPIESLFLSVGADTLGRVSNFLAANNPQYAAKIKKDVLDAVKQIKSSGDENKIEKMKEQLQKLESLGMDKIVPSEGIVFMYKGRPYKFTGTFAPINQILGTLQFDKSKKDTDEPVEKDAKEPDSKKTSAPEKSGAPVSEPKTAKVPEGPPRTVAVFVGRFQPFHAGHHSVYKFLVDKFGPENVFIGTSNHTDSIKSPFGFNEKKDIITTMFGISDSRVVQVKNPYNPVEVLEKFPENTRFVTAFSEKDAERIGDGKYFKNYDKTSDQNKKGYKEEGYYIVAPEMKLTINGKNISGTQLRFIMGSPNITDRAKQEIFTKAYGKFDKKIFQKVVKVSTEAEEAKNLTTAYTDDKPSASTKDKKKPVVTKDKESEDDAPRKKRLTSILKQRIKNPKTGKEIFVGTALKYDKTEPVYVAASDLVKKSLTR